MASMKVVARELVCVAALALPLMAVGCGGNDPPSRPDAAVGTDAYTPGTDTGMVVTMTDAGGTDAPMTTRMCRSPMGACDLLAQDCMAGEACVYALPEAGATTPQTVCAPIVGAGAEEGGACCALNSCDAGLVCVGAMETMPGSGTCSAMGTCRRYCCGSATDCAAGEVCSGFGGGFNGGICDTIDGCNLVDQTGCEGMAGTSCYPADGGATQCVRPTAAMAAEGATCMFTNDCVAGTACFTITSMGMMNSTCLRFCNIADGAAGCPMSGGMACQMAGDLPAGVGVCPPPA